MLNVGFIGAGNMGTAIIKGIASSQMADQIKLFAYDTSLDKLSALKPFGVEACQNNADIVSQCKYVFLAIKPQMFDAVLGEIGSLFEKNHVIISIAAGITSAYIKSKTLAEAKVVTVMPNTPLLLGEGATALAKSDGVDEAEFEFVCSIFESCGEIAVLDESKMKEVIAINGSSPAFIYLFAKGFIDYAESVGIPRQTAVTLFSKSLIGSAKMITDSGYGIDELIKMVSSPGGTTLAGLDRLYEGKLTEVVNNACKSCTKRAYELSK